VTREVVDGECSVETSRSGLLYTFGVVMLGAKAGPIIREVAVSSLYIKHIWLISRSGAVTTNKYKYCNYTIL